MYSNCICFRSYRYSFIFPIWNFWQTHTHAHLIIGGGQYAIFKSDTFRVNSTHLVNIILLLNGMHETNGRPSTVATGTKLEHKTTFGPLLFIDEIWSEWVKEGTIPFGCYVLWIIQHRQPYYVTHKHSYHPSREHCMRNKRVQESEGKSKQTKWCKSAHEGECMKNVN